MVVQRSPWATARRCTTASGIASILATAQDYASKDPNGYTDLEQRGAYYYVTVYNSCGQVLYTQVLFSGGVDAVCSQDFRL